MPAFLAGDGEAGRLIAARDWSGTPLGAIEGWPQSLRTAVSILLRSPVPIVMLWGEDGVMLYNDAYSVFAGGRHPALLGSKVREGWPEVAAFNDNVMRVGLAGGTLSYRGQELTLYRHGHPEQVWLDLDYSPVLDEEGRPAGVVAIVVETTERVLADRRVAEEAEQLRLVVEGAKDYAILTTDRDRRVTGWSAGAQAAFGYAAEEIVGQPADILFTPEDRAAGQPDWEVETARHEGSAPDVRWHLRQDGSRVFLNGSVRLLHDAAGGEIGFLKIARDESERRRADEALAEETRTLETLNRTGAALAAELDLERLVQMVTDAGVELTGARFGAYFHNVMDETGERLHLFTLSGAERAHFERMGRPRATAVFGPTFRNEGVIRSDDILADPRYGRNAPHKGMPEGHLPVRSYLAVSVVSRSGSVLGGLLFGHPEPGRFTPRHERLMLGIAAQAAVAIDNARLYERLEAEVADRTAELDRVWRNSRDLLVVIGGDGIFRAVSPSWTAILGHDPAEVTGHSFQEFIWPEDLELTQGGLDAASARRNLTDFENRYRHKDGTPRWISWHTAAEGELVYAYGRDVTALKAQADALAQAEDQLRQSQKMETVGQLTGGVAHDFNNLLQIVTGNLEMVQRRLGSAAEPRVKRSAEAAITGAKRAAVLTQRLLAFSRRSPLAPKPVDVNLLVQGMQELLHRTLGETITLEAALAPDAWRVEADPNQLENALLNLAVNARDAMADGGTLRIATANQHLDRAGAAGFAEAQPGQYVLLTASDTGTGMDAATAARAFEPFFTTKEVGKGTGLGLSMVYGFVRQSGGHVRISSSPGAGTTVQILLPRLLGATEEEVQDAQSPAPQGRREETVLVCEDDEGVRAYSVEALRELGYRVLEAGDGPSALGLLEQEDGRVDLLFSDVVLPGGMTGADLASAARRLRPGLRVLFATGYARDAIVHGGRLDPGVELLAKPFTYADLAARVREVLDG